MAKPDFIRHSGVALYADETQMKRVNSVSVDASFKDEDILELANDGVAETIDDLDTVSMTVDCHEFGSSDNFAHMVNYFQSGDNNDHYIHDSLFDDAQVDFILQISSGTSTSALAASCWIGSQWFSGFSISYSADGNATESFSLEGEYKRWFMNAYRDMEIVSGTRVASNTEFTIYGQELAGTHTPRILTVNGIIQADVNASGTISFNDDPPDTDVTATTDGSTAVTFASGDRIRVVMAKNTPDSFPAIATTPAGIGALRRGMVDIYLFNGASGTEEKTLRLQSVTIDGSMDRTATPELGTHKMYARSLDRPISVEASCEVNLSDLEVFAKIANKETEFDNMSLNEIDWDAFSTDTKLIVKLYKNETSHIAANLLKTIVVDDITITAGGDSVDAGGLATATFTLKGQHIIVSGSSVSPFL